MLFFSTFLVLVAAVAAIPAPDIIRNSDRLARNLPPLPPKFKRTMPGYPRAEDGPTAAYSAKSPSTSSRYVSYKGRIEVRHEKHTVGYVGNSKGNLGVNLGHVQDIHVNFWTTSSGAGPFNLVALDPSWKGAPYLGAHSAHVPELTDKLDFTHVGQTLPQSFSLRARDGYEGSAIWSIDPSTKELTAHWLDENKDNRLLHIAYEDEQNNIFFVGDFQAYQNENKNSASAVKFYLVPDDS